MRSHLPRSSTGGGRPRDYFAPTPRALVRVRTDGPMGAVRARCAPNGPPPAEAGSGRVAEGGAACGAPAGGGTGTAVVPRARGGRWRCARCGGGGGQGQCTHLGLPAISLVFATSIGLFSSGPRIPAKGPHGAGSY